MTTWPKPNQGIPEGHYTFTLNQEPDLEKFMTQSGESRRLILYVVSTPGDHKHKESFVPWDPRYDDLCRVLGVEHGKDIRMEGASFQADVVYEPGKKDPEKSYARLKNIVPAGEFCPKTGDGDGDIPF
jgi:hypothetical protein